MNDHVISISQTPTHQIHKKKKNPKNMARTQNLGLNCMNACKWRDLGCLLSDLSMM